MIDLHSLYTPKQTETWLHKKWKEMKKKQTAVEWLIVQLKKVDYNPLEQNGYSKAEERLFDQAKAMEKEQIMKAYGQGIADEAGEILDATKDAQQYYNETFKSE